MGCYGCKLHLMMFNLGLFQHLIAFFYWHTNCTRDVCRAFSTRNFHLRKSLQQKTLISIRTHALKIIVFFTPDEKLFFLPLKVFLFYRVAEDSALAKLTRIMNENCFDFACNLPKLIRWIRWDMRNYPKVIWTIIFCTTKTKHANFFVKSFTGELNTESRDSQRGI